MKKIMILLAAMAMATLSIQANEPQDRVEITTTSMEADSAVAEEKGMSEADQNTTKEAAYNEAS